MAGGPEGMHQTRAADGPLRVGLLCRGPVFRAWQADVVRELMAVPGVEISVLVVEPRERGRRRLADLKPDPTWLWRLFNNRWVARRSRALRSVDLTAELDKVPSLVCRTERKGKWSEHFSADDLAAIRAHQPDVLIRFAYGIIRGEILDLPRYGIWSFHHGDVERYRGGPPAFWELVRDDDVTGAVLQRLTDRLDGGVVLRSGWFSTVKHSYTRNADRVRFGGASWPAQVCRQVQAGSTDLLDAPPTTSTAPIDHNPTNAQMVRFLVRLGTVWIRHQVRAIAFADRWRIGVIDRPIEDVVRDPTSVEPRWVTVGIGRNEYVADPFPLAPNSEVVFAERFSYGSGRGRIIALGTSRKAAWTHEVDVPVGRHLSYPFIVDDGTDFICVPQITGAPGVRSFRVDDGAGALIDERLLVADVEARDPTIVHHDGRWWCFFTDGDRGAMSHLHLWWADELDGPWFPHADNPVKVDVRSARPAGTPFVVDGALHRPAQDCSRGYGGAVVINRVECLTTTTFSERPVARVEPRGAWSRAAGCHTLSAWGDRTLIDAHWKAVLLPALRAELRARFGRGASRKR